MMDYKLVQKYLVKTEDRPLQPYPWHPDQDNTGTSTLHYARMLLDALAGDERRTEFRRVYRLFRIHQKAGDFWKNPSYFMLVEVCLDFCDILPYHVLKRHLGPIKDEPLHGLSRTPPQAVFAG